MSFSIGIVGLPNVGKSTLFNALTNLDVVAANYPFATIEPNVGIVPVPDERLQKLAEMEKSAEIIPTIVEFHDIAGLVKGAHQGEGLGNQFLHHIREVDAILEVVRDFSDPNVTHVAGELDPGRDMETIETELALADLQMLEKKLDNLRSKAKGHQKEDDERVGLAEKYYETLSNGQMARTVNLSEQEQKYDHEFPLLTKKPILIVLNTSNINNAPDLINGNSVIAVDAKTELEITRLDQSEKQDYLESFGLKMTALDRIIKESYKLLNLVTFFTAGPKETRAWTCQAGSLAPQAAGKIHTDFERGFIKAEIIGFDDLMNAGSWNHARDIGKLRTEGKNYTVCDGDVVFFKFNV